jgi:hypothetical protein
MRGVVVPAPCHDRRFFGERIFTITGCQQYPGLMNGWRMDRGWMEDALFLHWQERGNGDWRANPAPAPGIKNPPRATF